MIKICFNSVNFNDNILKRIIQVKEIKEDEFDIIFSYQMVLYQVVLLLHELVNDIFKKKHFWIQKYWKQ